LQKITARAAVPAGHLPVIPNPDEPGLNIILFVICPHMQLRQNGTVFDY
jgi:hypothetical protein